MKDKLKNNFGIYEWSGAIGDLGTLLPLAFALVVMNGFPPQRIFLLWGLVYIVSGWVYKVPVSVQPLKAMSVIAITKGYSPEFLSSTSFFYGVLLILLSLTGALNWLKKWFSAVIVRGVQLGIGLILAQKALQLVWDKGFLLNHNGFSLPLNFFILFLTLLSLYYIQFKKKIPLALILIFISVITFKLVGISIEFSGNIGGAIALSRPNLSFFVDSFIFLIIPQLPLTLGNAVFAANDVCHTLWNEQAERVTPTRLAWSIGLSDIFIGLLGGFPICHGAGGMGAHAQFGAKTGGATIIIGTVFVLVALISPMSTFLFLIPVPLLSAMLLFDSWRMATLVTKLSSKADIWVAMLVGGISFATNDLFIALIVGIIVESTITFFYSRRTI